MKLIYSGRAPAQPPWLKQNQFQQKLLKLSKFCLVQQNCSFSKTSFSKYLSAQSLTSVCLIAPHSLLLLLAGAVNKSINVHVQFNLLDLADTVDRYTYKNDGPDMTDTFDQQGLCKLHTNGSYK
jgi:hypothetical protein